MNNVKIYICCHKDYEPVGIDNPCYCIISDKDIKNGSSLPFVKSDGFLENRIWSELSHIYYVWKHPELQADWVGFCHYRRYFEFMNDIPELTKPIIPQPLNLSFNNFMSYFVNHNAYDLMQVLTLMKKKESPYIREALMMCDSHTYYPFNMFVFPKDLFNELCEFMFDILLEYDKFLKVDNSYDNMIAHVADYRELYVEKNSSPNNEYKYQARLYGFLAERLFTVFIIKKLTQDGMKSMVRYKVKVTEETYNRVKL